MKNRLNQTLSQARRRKAKLFCAYLTLGYPSLAQTKTAILALQKAGTDILELGFPFSDPLADGPTIQRASEHAIAQGVRLEDAFRLIQKLRRRGLKIPVLLFSYFNPLLQYGVARLARALERSGFDGLIVPDLPPEEGKRLEVSLRRLRLSLVYLIAPTTGQNRMRQIARHSDGFIYYVSLRGVTGVRRKVPPDLIQNLRRLKRVTKKPVLVGFGVSEPKQARSIVRTADGIVVGSAIVDRLRNGKNPERTVAPFVSRLVNAMK